MIALVLLLAVFLIGYVVYNDTRQRALPRRRPPGSRMRTTYLDGSTEYTPLASTDAYTPGLADTYGTMTDEVPPSHDHHVQHHPQHGYSSGGGASGDWSDDPHGNHPVISSDTTHHASHDFGGMVDTGHHHTLHESSSYDYGSGSDTGSSHDYGASSDSSAQFDSGHHHHD